MRVQSVLCCYICTLLCLSQVHAMFFTDSKENEYPRLGKRVQPLPKYVYKKWFGMSDNIYSYDPGSIRSEESFIIPEEGLTDREFVGRDLSGKTGSVPTPTRVKERKSFVKQLWLYLSVRPEDF